MERKLYLLSPLQAEFYENESDRMYPDDVMDGRALAVYGADILQKMQERADHVGEDLMEYYDEKDSVKEKVTNLELSVVLKAGELMGCAEVTIQAPLDRWEMNRLETYLTGQYSDGWGEGFEQQDIPVEDGVLNVHFWNSDYFRMDILHKITELQLPLETVTELPPLAKELNFTIENYKYCEMPKKKEDILTIKLLTGAGEIQGIRFESKDNGETWAYAGISVE